MQAAGDPGAPPAGNFERSLRDAAVYSLALAVQRAIGFLLLPLYTRAMAPDEYGALGVLLSVATLATVVFAAGLEIAIFRSYFELASDPERQRRYLDSVWRFLTVYPLAAALSLSLAAWPVVGNGGQVTGLDVCLTLLGAALSVAGLTLPLAVLRAQQNLKQYLVVSAVSTLLVPLLGVVLVVGLDLGLRGFLTAIVVANGATFLASFVVMPWRSGASFDAPMVRGALGFSLPLLPHTLSHWALQLADRAVLAGLVSAATLGVYSLAANIAAPLLMLVMTLNQGFMPTYARAGTMQGAAEELRGVVVFQVAAVVVLTLAGALLGPSIVELMAPSSYHEAGSLVPWLVLGYGFLGLYLIPMNGATLGAGRSKHVWIATALAAVSNVALILIMVPPFGIEAAAVASAAAYFVLLLGTSIWAHTRSNPVEYEWRRIIPTVISAFVVYGLADLTSPVGLTAALVVDGLWILAFAVSLAALGVVPAGVLGRLRRR